MTEWLWAGVIVVQAANICALLAVIHYSKRTTAALARIEKANAARQAIR